MYICCLFAVNRINVFYNLPKVLINLKTINSIMNMLKLRCSLTLTQIYTLITGLTTTITIFYIILKEKTNGILL